MSDGQDSQHSSSSTTIHWSQLCHQFEFQEIQSATDDFDESRVIGSGGFGKVYRATIYNGSNPIDSAIKRLDSSSHQGAPEFWAEVEMLSKLRHSHLVSLFGYCNHGKEMILVYEYMPNGTLGDHLHKFRTPISWLQRLKICIGAARGLDYLHTGTDTEFGVIHRDVKSSNILLNKSWAAKISDFGLSKITPTNQTLTGVDTLVKGTFGYFDPDYYWTGRLTRKSDVYAFGVVLLEVLCRKRAVDISLGEDQPNLARWAQESIKEGKIKHIIDHDISSEISLKCLKEFIGVAERCLDSIPKQRPTMAEVVVGLQSALSLQEKSNSSMNPVGRTIFGRMVDMFPFPSKGENSAQGDSKTSSKDDGTPIWKAFKFLGLKDYKPDDLKRAKGNFSKDLTWSYGQTDLGRSEGSVDLRELYNQYKWLETHGVDEESLGQKYLRRDIKRQLCLSLVKSVSLFENMNERLLDAICERLIPCLFTENTYIVRDGDPIEEMLFISHGCLESLTIDGDRSGFFNCNWLKEGDFCGEELLTWVFESSHDLPSSTRTIRALTEVEAFVLPADELIFLIRQFRPLDSRLMQHNFRYYSQQWRTWAAYTIQAAWQRHCMRKILQKEEEEGAESATDDGSCSLGSSILVNLPKPQEPDFTVTRQFRLLDSRQMKHNYRHYSQQWRTWAACIIQAAWVSHSKRKITSQRRKEEVQEAELATDYRSSNLTANELRGVHQNWDWDHGLNLNTDKELVNLPKPQKTDFNVTNQFSWLQSRQMQHNYKCYSQQCQTWAACVIQAAWVSHCKRKITCQQEAELVLRSSYQNSQPIRGVHQNWDWDHGLNLNADKELLNLTKPQKTDFNATNQFSWLHSRQMQHNYKYYSQQWRTWAACFIQAAWVRHCKSQIHDL